MPSLRWSLTLACSAIVLLVAACGGDDDSSTKPTPFPSSSDPAGTVPATQRRPVNVVMAGADWFVGENNFVIGLTNAKDLPQGGAKVKVTVFDLKDSKNPKPIATVDATPSAPGVGPVTQHQHPNGETHQHGGENEDRVGYYFKVNFDHAGLWGISVDATLKDGTKGTDNIGFQVKEKPAMPAPGQKALKSDNLTKKDVANIKEIDSGIPPNDMHDVKIKDAIAAGRPLVVLFATPAYCTSRFCGPVEQEVESLQTTYRDKVDFVHIEIWRDFDKKLINPTAKEWLQQPDGSLTEPIVFVIDKTGTIYERWEGPVARNIMEPAVQAVAGGATYAK